MSLKNPVQYPVKYYSWQDDKAPLLQDADGVIKTILKACLVTGYGSKKGAGWTSPFEDDYRIVLRRPLRTGNPPDIKIENGVINGVASHRIVAQDNPTGVGDTNELSSVFLLGRDSNCGREWYCLVTDFAFVLCYQMSEPWQGGIKNYMLFVGGAKKLLDSDNEYFFATAPDSLQKNGMIGPVRLTGFMDTAFAFYEMRQKTNTRIKNKIDINVAERYFNNDYFAQKILIDTFAEMPIFCSISSQIEDSTVKEVNISDRRMLRYPNRSVDNYIPRAFYIPLDYWEL